MVPLPMSIRTRACRGQPLLALLLLLLVGPVVSVVGAGDWAAGFMAEHLAALTAVAGQERAQWGAEAPRIAALEAGPLQLTGAMGQRSGARRAARRLRQQPHADLSSSAPHWAKPWGPNFELQGAR